MADLADHAFAHAVAVLGAGAAAEHAATRAVRMGGRSLWSVLAHARHAAVSGAPGPPGRGAAVITATDSPVPDDPTELARVLAATRPPAERAVVDLDTRHGLDRRDFARALGMAPEAAAALATAVATAWETELDPVLLARRGPAGCELLEGILESAGLWQPPPANPPLGPMPVPPPPDAGNGGSAVRKPEAETGPVPVAQDNPVFVPPPEGEPGPAEPAEERRETGPPSLATVVAAAPMVGDHLRICPACASRRRAMESVRDLLGHVPLETAPEAVRATAPARRLRRPALPPPVLGHHRAPRRRRAAVAAAAAALVLTAAGAVAMATGSRDGPVADRPPVVEVTADRCGVTARVTDEGEVRSVVLHWSPAGSPRPETWSVPMRRDGGDYAAGLPSGPVPLTWWVTATDGRGNTTRTTDAVLPPGTC